MNDLGQFSGIIKSDIECRAENKPWAQLGVDQNPGWEGWKERERDRDKEKREILSEAIQCLHLLKEEFLIIELSFAGNTEVSIHEVFL